MYVLKLCCAILLCPSICLSVCLSSWYCNNTFKRRNFHKMTVFSRQIWNRYISRTSRHPGQNTLCLKKTTLVFHAMTMTNIKRFWFDHFWQVCYQENKQLKVALFFHLTWLMFLHYLVKQQTQKLPFHLNAVCCFVNRHTKPIKTSPGHSKTNLHIQNDRLSAPDRSYRK